MDAVEDLITLDVSEILEISGLETQLKTNSITNSEGTNWLR